MLMINILLLQKLTADNFGERLAETDLASKTVSLIL